MNLFIAGIYTSNFELGGRIYNRLPDVEKQSREQVVNYLESYHYIKKQSYVDKVRSDGKKVFLDSGAFSAFTKGVDVSLPDYCTYIQEHDDIIERSDGTVLASVLDAIGDPLKTWQNQQAMERLGVTPLPCFHYGEDERYLEDYINKYDYITLGGMVPVNNKVLKIWLDRIWEKYLIDGAGRPRLKVHGFGVMTEVFLKAYPWFSVDSSTWVQKALNGMLLGHTLGGKLLPDLHISENSPRVKVHGAHFATMTREYKTLYRADIEQRGYSLLRLVKEYASRWCYNIQIMNELNEKYRNADIEFRPLQRRLF